MLASSFLTGRPSIQEIDEKIESLNHEISVIQAEIRCLKEHKNTHLLTVSKVPTTSCQSSLRHTGCDFSFGSQTTGSLRTPTPSHAGVSTLACGRARFALPLGLHICICTTSYRSAVFGPCRLGAFIPTWIRWLQRGERAGCAQSPRSIERNHSAARGARRGLVG